MTDSNIEMSSVRDTKGVRQHAQDQSGASSDEEATVFKGQIDPVYEAKAVVLNKAVRGLDAFPRCDHTN